MNVDRAVLAFAGFVVLVSTVLSLTVNPWWSALTIFAGLNLLQSSVTGFCPAASLFRKLGVGQGSAF